MSLESHEGVDTNILGTITTLTAFEICEPFKTLPDGRAQREIERLWLKVQGNACLRGTAFRYLLISVCFSCCCETVNSCHIVGNTRLVLLD